MILFQTEILKQTANYPTKLDFQRIITARDRLNTSQNKSKLERIETGLLGEEKVIHLLEEQKKDNWIVIRNLWLDYNNNTFEIDIILITNYCVYLFEVKNYTGSFIYENGACILNGWKMDNDIIQQTRKIYLRIKRIFERLQAPIKVKGILVFINDKNKVRINSPVEDITILDLPDFYEYIKEIVRDENKKRPQIINSNEIIDQLQRFEIMHPYLPKPIPRVAFEKLQTGIHCVQCKNFNIEIKKLSIECQCGLEESREEAMVRTICDYGVLNYTGKLTTGAIYNFLGNTASDTYTQEILAKHFEMVPKNKYTYYKVRILPFYKIHNTFKI